MLKYILLASCLVLTTGCQTAKTSTAEYSSTSDARIRLYGQNQKPTILEYEKDGKKQKINVGGEVGDAFSSLIGTVDNKNIGIAQTDMSKNLKDHNGMLSKIFYKEFVIPAETTVSVRNNFQGLTNVSKTPTQTTIVYEGSCTSSGLTFTTKAGKDYEAVPVGKDSSCGLVLLEVDHYGSTAVVDLAN